MEIRLARHEDCPALARLLWSHAAPDEQARQPVEDFAADLARWWEVHADTHLPFIADVVETRAVGMVWLALLARAPRPGAATRHSADLQSLFVLPEHRGQGIGSALVSAATEHAARLGARRVTVGSGRRAVPLYERLGYAASRQLLERTVDQGLRYAALP